MRRSEPQFVVGVSAKLIMRHSEPLVQLRAEALIIRADAFFINQSEHRGTGVRRAGPRFPSIASLSRLAT
jgi:hypothetical protein